MRLSRGVNVMLYEKKTCYQFKLLLTKYNDCGRYGMIMCFSIIIFFILNMLLGECYNQKLSR